MLRRPQVKKRQKLLVTLSGCWSSKWFSQPTFLSRKQGATKQIRTYFYCVAAWCLLLLLKSEIGRLNFCTYWRSSVGWILCWDDADAGDCLSDFSMVLLVLIAGFCGDLVFNIFIFSHSNHLLLQHKAGHLKSFKFQYLLSECRTDFECKRTSVWLNSSHWKQSHVSSQTRCVFVR